jgi:hypothetical protein
VDVHVNEAGIDGEACEVETLRVRHLFARRKNARDAPVLDQ